MPRAGCLGLLAIPFTSVAIGFRLLISPTTQRSPTSPLGPYRVAAPVAPGPYAPHPLARST